MKRKVRWGAIGAALMLVLMPVLAACVSQGDVDHPVVRKFTWFSYLNGDDLREQCRAGGTDRYRFILNNRYQRQVRMYELTGPMGSVPARLNTRVQGRTNFFEVIPGLEQNWSWHGRTDVVSLDDAQYEDLMKSVADSGAFAPAPTGLWLESDGTYWVSIACRGGQLYYNAWQYPNDRFEAVVFDDVLWRYDMTEVPVEDFVKKRNLNPTYMKHHNIYDFRLEVGDNGLNVGKPLFGGILK